MTVFDATDHVELNDADVMWAVYRELTDDAASKWERGGVTSWMEGEQRVYALEINPKAGSHTALQPINATLGFHLQRFGPSGFGVILAMTPEQYAEYLGNA